MSASFPSLRRRASLARQLAGNRRPALAALPLTAILDTLGTTGWTDLGVRDIDLARVVGTAARPDDFDRRMRPLRPHLRRRWEQVADAMDTGRPLPVIEVAQLDELYFVLDGHHRVSVARARGSSQIEAKITAVCTVAYACHCITLPDLPHKAAERDFLQRFPLPDTARHELWLDHPEDYQRLTQAAEQWLHGHRDGAQASAAQWWAEHVIPVARRCRPNSTNTAADYLCAASKHDSRDEHA